MVTSLKQIDANRRNALLSTGPSSSEGKEVVSRNAVKHGILSRSLLLDDESPEEYQALVIELQNNLQPHGVLEFTLVEKIAIALWRQKRLVRAETATIDESRQPMRILEEVRESLGHDCDIQLTEEEVTKDDEQHIQWCENVIAEIERCVVRDVSDLEKEAPLTYKFAVERVKEGCSLQEYLMKFGGADKYLKKLEAYCRSELRKEGMRIIARRVVEQVRDKRCIPEDKYLELFARYQVMLDGELYKAIKVLREAQAWRFKAIVNDVNLGNASAG
jgi:hypothetical protein